MTHEKQTGECSALIRNKLFSIMRKEVNEHDY